MKLIFVSYLILLITACNNGESEFINHNKWETGNIYNPSKLKGNPKEIRDSIFLSLNDTLFSSNLKGVFRENYVYQFDRTGNLIFIKTILDTFISSDAFYKFDKEGAHYEFVTYSPHGDTSRSKKVSEKIGKEYFNPKHIATTKKHTEILYNFTIMVRR